LKAIRFIAALLAAASILSGCKVDVDDDTTTVKPAKVTVETPD
jgi:hypothetical protein